MSMKNLFRGLLFIFLLGIVCPGRAVAVDKVIPPAPAEDSEALPPPPPLEEADDMYDDSEPLPPVPPAEEVDIADDITIVEVEDLDDDEDNEDMIPALNDDPGENLVTGSERLYIVDEEDLLEDELDDNQDPAGYWLPMAEKDGLLDGEMGDTQDPALSQERLQRKREIFINRYSRDDQEADEMRERFRSADAQRAAKQRSDDNSSTFTDDNSPAVTDDNSVPPLEGQSEYGRVENFVPDDANALPSGSDYGKVESEYMNMQDAERLMREQMLEEAEPGEERRALIQRFLAEDRARDPAGRDPQYGSISEALAEYEQADEALEEEGEYIPLADEFWKDDKAESDEKVNNTDSDSNSDDAKSAGTSTSSTGIKAKAKKAYKKMKIKVTGTKEQKLKLAEEQKAKKEAAAKQAAEAAEKKKAEEAKKKAEKKKKDEKDSDKKKRKK